MATEKGNAALTLQETAQKVEASLQEAINEHVSSTEFSASQHGLDFFRVKNSMMLTYLIELTHQLRSQLSGQQHAGSSEASLHRLTVMKTALDKVPKLEKKLRYQIDKLLASGDTSTSFVTAGSEEDPLQLRPDTSSLNEDGDEDDDGSGQDAKASSGGASSSDDEEEDEDLAAARLTVTASRGSKSKVASKTASADSDEEDDNGLYRAPRHSAVLYNLDQDDRASEREKRKLKRMRASELAQALRAEYGEAPEQEDIDGGAELGRQRDAAKRFARQQEEKTEYEEGAMVRLTTTRKEKKEHKKLLREESSNLAAISDLGNIVRDAAALDEQESRRRKRQHSKDEYGSPSLERRANGKRTHQQIDADGRPVTARKQLEAKNSLQAALYGGDSKKKSKKRSKK